MSKIFLSTPHYSGSEKKYIDVTLSKEDVNSNLIFFERSFLKPRAKLNIILVYIYVKLKQGCKNAIYCICIMRRKKSGGEKKLKLLLFVFKYFPNFLSCFF